MVTELELEEYLGEIRKQVCSRCVERPPGGPPCAPLGKDCGVELHLPALIDSIHEVHSGRIDPYLVHNRQTICAKCAFLHSSICPCPMDYLAVLVVEAVETVDKRRPAPLQAAIGLAGEKPLDAAEIERLYQEAAGTWSGCDWPTHFGTTNLNLNGWTAAQAEAVAGYNTWTEEGENWRQAAWWLGRVEEHARLAEAEAAAAVAGAKAGNWLEAFHHAEKAWALEFATGRPLRHRHPLTWQKFRQAVETALLAHEAATLHPDTGK